MFLFIFPPNNTGNLLNHKKCGSWRCASSEGGEWNRSVKCNERKASQFAASIVKQKRKLIMFPVERTHLLLLISDEHRLHCVSIFSSSADWWVSSKSFCIRTHSDTSSPSHRCRRRRLYPLRLLENVILRWLWGWLRRQKDTQLKTCSGGVEVKSVSKTV